MLKSLYFALLFVTASGIFAVHAQSPSGPPGAAAGHKASGPLIENYLAPTGETVQRPGVPQGSPTTSLDRRIERENNHLDKSICSNCN